jgi:hypothetical protein
VAFTLVRGARNAVTAVSVSCGHCLVLQGKMSLATLNNWMAETPSPAKLPERKKPKKR